MRKLMKQFDSWMSAVTFAEAGEPDLAREYIGVKPKPEKAESLVLPGIRIWFGSVALEPVPIPGTRVWYGTVAG